MRRKTALGLFVQIERSVFSVFVKRKKKKKEREYFVFAE
jgi:hypothetical protein